MLAGPAAAGQLIDRNATQIKLQVDSKSRAMLEYKVGVRHCHVLVWGAINAKIPKAGSNGKPNQVEFNVDYSGGWKSFGHVLYPTFKNACRPYTGPAIPYVVAACDAPDGSYWALQSWQSELPDLGFTPWIAKQSSWRLKIAHWKGPLPKLELYTYWRNGSEALFGRYTYLNKGIFGFHATPFGEPTDTYGRLMYLDTYNAPQYGSGWLRENSFLPHSPNGNYCYVFKVYNPHTGGYAAPPSYKSNQRGPGNGDKYRLTAVGTGVMPDIQVQVNGIGAYDPTDPTKVAYQQKQAALAKQIAGSDPSCR